MTQVVVTALMCAIFALVIGVVVAVISWGIETHLHKRNIEALNIEVFKGAWIIAWTTLFIVHIYKF